MNPSWSAVAAGAIGLAVLDGVLQPQASANVGGWVAGAGKAIQWFLSPAVPAFSTTTTPASTTASSSAAPIVEAAAGTTVVPPSSSASGQSTGPTVGGPPVTIQSPVGPIQEVAA
jgi:hypothetical protein